MSESAPAGGVISLAMVIGACLGLAVTPLIVSGPDDIPESIQKSHFGFQFAFWYFDLKIEMQIEAQMRRTV